MGLVSKPEAKPETSRGYCMNISYREFFKKQKHFILTVAKLPVSSDTLGMVSAIIMPALIGIIGIKTYKILFALWPVTRSTLGWEPPTLFEGIRIFLVSPLAFLAVAYSAAYFVLWQRLLTRRWLRAILLFLLPLIALPLAKVLWVGIKGENLTGIESSWAYQIVHVYGDALSDIQFLSGIYRTDIFFLVGYGLLSTLALSVVPNRWRRLVFSLFICLSATILVVAGLELAHYLKTGMNGNASMLMYFLANADDLWDMVRDEVNWKTIVAILAPPFLILLCPLIIRLVKRNPWINWQQGKSVFNAGKVIWLVLLAGILAPEHIDQAYIRLRGNIVLNFGQELLFQPDIPTEAFKEGKALRQAALNLEFVPTARAQRLNIVVVLLESVRADATGVYNPSLQNTPFLRELSKKSLVANEMYAVIPRTSAAWVSVLNGMYPSINSALMYWAYREAGHPKFASLPRLLRKTGYKSAFFVPTHLNYENEGQLLFNMGFDQIVSEKDYGKTSYEHVNYFGLEDRVMIDPIMSWVDAQRKDHNPFFLTVMTNVGHEKYTFPSTWKKREFIGNSNEDYNNYLNCIAYIDDFLKRLFNEFQRRELFQNTIFFVLGDHGEPFGERGTKERALSMYEEELHIPMLIFAPSLFHDGGEIIGPRQQVDILPTIADILGFSINGDLPPGLSLLRDNPKDRELYYSCILEGIAIGMRKGSRKYIYKFDSAPMEVFDLEKDPDERHDLAGEISETEALMAKNQMLKWYGATRLSMTGSEPDHDLAAAKPIRACSKFSQPQCQESQGDELQAGIGQAPGIFLKSSVLFQPDE
jgi:lipoteichoic acid synthase